jgi:hypothetical protein
MLDIVGQRLKELIDRFGVGVCDDPQRFQGLLRDLCGQHKQRTFVLICACREGVPRELLRQAAQAPPAVLAARLCRQLRENCGLAEDSARWAVETWASALALPDIRMSSGTAIIAPDDRTPAGLAETRAVGGAIPDTEADVAVRIARRWILWLVVVHVVVGTALAMLAAWIRNGATGWTHEDYGLQLVLLATVNSQASLLGMWGGLGTSSWSRRLFGVAAGVGYLTLVLWLVLEEASDRIFVMASVPTLSMVGILLVVRCFRVRLCAATEAGVAVPRMSFSKEQLLILALLILTLLVGCLVLLEKWVWPFVMERNDLVGFLLLMLVAETPGLVTLWLVLGTKHPVLPSTILAVVAVVALAVAVARRSHHPYSDWAGLLFVLSTEALTLVASLWVVRSAGFRMRRLAVSRTTANMGAI